MFLCCILCVINNNNNTSARQSCLFAETLKNFSCACTSRVSIRQCLPMIYIRRVYNVIGVCIERTVRNIRNCCWRVSFPNCRVRTFCGCVSGCPSNCKVCTYDGSNTRCLTGACDRSSYFDSSTASCICESCLLTYVERARPAIDSRSQVMYGKNKRSVLRRSVCLQILVIPFWVFFIWNWIRKRSSNCSKRKIST